MDNQEILHLIDISPLTDEQKASLTNQVQAEGITEQFYDTFNRLLLDKIKESESQYLKVMDQFTRATGLLEQELEKEQALLENKLQQTLERIGPLDFEKRNQAWDEFYQKTEQLWLENENKLKSITTTIYASLI